MNKIFIERIIIAGSGGQGIMLLGKILAETAMGHGKYVTWLPAYGAEVRGGTAHCMVIISDSPIGSPFIDKADTLIIMNQPSLEKFRQRINKKGLLIINSSLVSKAIKAPGQYKLLSRPFSEIAVQLGNIKVANMVVLGCYFAYRKIFQIREALNIIDKIAPASKRGLIKINKEALYKGSRLTDDES